MMDDRSWLKRGVDILIAERGTTQAEVARTLNMTPPAFLKRIKRDDATVVFLAAVCRVLGTTASEFLRRFAEEP